MRHGGWGNNKVALSEAKGFRNSLRETSGFSRCAPRKPFALLRGTGLLLGLAFPLAAQTPALGPQLDAWMAKTNRSSPGKWGVVVADVTGRVIWQVNGSEPMKPASTVKVLTTGFTRSVVGGDARRATRVLGTGHLDPVTGTWVGEWVLELNGDPTLERPNKSGPTLLELAQQLAATGIRQLVGPLTVTTSAGEPRSSYPSVWSDRDRGRTFAPPIGPITLNENIAEFTVAPGAKVGARPVVVGDAPRGVASLVTVTATTVAGKGNSLGLSTQQASGRWIVAGRIGVNAKPHYFAIVVNDPTAVLDAAWQHATAAAGIKWIRASGISTAEPTNRRILAQVVSDPLDSIAHEVNTRSLNIGAELMLRWGGGPDNPADKLMAHVRAITGIDGIHLVDGSGLSEDDRVTPLTFTTYLAKFPQTAAGKNFPLLLPANGSGTLRRLAWGLPGPGVVRAKTGTLENVATLVGYLGRDDGTLLIAAMYDGNVPWNARQAEWDLFRQLGAHGIVIPPNDASIGGSQR